MKCPNCNKEIDDGSVFCTFCGQPIDAKPAAEEAVKVEDAPIVEEKVEEVIADDEPIVEENKLDYVKVLLSSNDLRHPLNIKNKNLELFDNGFSLKNDYIKIHPAYFFDRVVGFFFSFND